MAKIEAGYSSPKETSKKSNEVKDDFGRTEETANIRKIKNGYLVKKCWQEGKGDKRQYKEEEEYFKENPL